MKITDKRQNKVVRFKDLKKGDTFVLPAEDNPRMKLDGDRYWNFSREDWFCAITMDDEVIPINVELTIV